MNSARDLIKQEVVLFRQGVDNECWVEVVAQLFSTGALRVLATKDTANDESKKRTSKTEARDSKGSKPEDTVAVFTIADSVYLL